MDRTILHNTTIQIQRKVKDCDKFTESVLCDEIHNNLRTLGLIYTFSDELREVFEKVSDLSFVQVILRLKHTQLMCRFVST